jgi:site-specific DNA recombinase
LNVGDLKAQQAAALDTLTTTQSAVARRKLEEKIDELEAQIQQAQTKRAEIEVSERDIKEFIKYAKYLMEHPADLLMDAHDMHVQRSLFGLVFEETPTYEEILNGTPKLSLVFKLSKEFSALKTQTVTLRGVEPRLQP